MSKFYTKPADDKSLTQTDVTDLVLDYLQSKGFNEARDVLKKELKKKPSNSPEQLKTSASSTKLEDLLEKSYVTEFATGEIAPKKRARSHLDAMLRTVDESASSEGKSGNALDEPEEKEKHLETKLISYNPMAENDPYGASVLPLYQTSTFAQPAADQFGDYDYTRSGNPTRDMLQLQIANLENSPNCKAFTFTSGMSALTTVSHLVKEGEEVIVNDDSYGGTYRLMSKVATKQGINVRYVNMAGKDGPANLKAALSPITRIVMIESPTNPMQRICNIRDLAKLCHENEGANGLSTLLSIDNTMMSPILQRPLELGADIVVHSATKFMAGHSDVMAGAIVVRDTKPDHEGKTLAQHVYFHQNAEGTALAPFDCWLVARGLKTMALRVKAQQANAIQVAQWLSTIPHIKKVYYAGWEHHPDYNIHMSQASGGGSVVCFETGNLELSKHIVTTTKLFKITVSFGSVNSLISLPGNMSHASIPAEVKSARNFPTDLVRISVGIEYIDDLLTDLRKSINSFPGLASLNKMDVEGGERK